MDLFKVALELHQAGHLNEAKAAYVSLLEESPQHYGALANLGVLYLQRAAPRSEDFERGVVCLRKSLEVNPNQASVHNNLANALTAIGDDRQSDVHYQTAIVLAPGYLEAYLNRALLLRKVSDLKQAGRWLAQYEAQFAEQPGFYLALGALLLDSGEVERSLAAFDTAIKLLPTSAQAWYNRGNALRLLHRVDECLASYRYALRLDPNIAEAWVNMGVAEQNLKHFDEAIDCYDAALRLRPNSVNATYNRALALENTWRVDEAVVGFEQTLSLEPNYPYLVGRLHHAKMLLCDWANYQNRLDRLTQGVLDGEKASVPFPFLAMSDDAQLQLRCAQTYVHDKCPLSISSWVPKSRNCEQRIRVGYVSADFRTHAVGFLTAGLFESHDQNNFEVFAISLGSAPEGDAYRDRIAAAVEHFVDVSRMTDDVAVETIRELELDIAIDLAGHTMDARTMIFSQRVAGLQVNYLGYPGSMGAPYMDVVIADEVVVPEGFDVFYSERVVRLPGTFQINDRCREIGPYRSREFYGLPEKGLVLASFNTSYKLNPPVFDIWCRLLNAVPNAALWLLGESEAQIKNLKMSAVARGVDPDRLIFAGRMAYADHLARFAHVDLVLDTLPFNGGTSTSDALWGGAPVLTCMGEAFAARMSASLLAAVGLSELITRSLAEYEKLGLELLLDETRLGALKNALAAARSHSSLFDTIGQTRALETAYMRLLSPTSCSDNDENAAANAGAS